MWGPVTSEVPQEMAPEPSQLTSPFLQFQDVVVGTGQLPDELPIILTLSQPAIALEAKRLVHGRVHHINIFQVPARGNS